MIVFFVEEHIFECLFYYIYNYFFILFPFFINSFIIYIFLSVYILFISFHSSAKPSAPSYLLLHSLLCHPVFSSSSSFLHKSFSSLPLCTHTQRKHSHTEDTNSLTHSHTFSLCTLCGAYKTFLNNTTHN